MGTRVTVGGLRGAQAPGRDIFVYRVEQEADEHEIEEYVKDMGLKQEGSPWCLSAMPHIDLSKSQLP